MLRTKLLFIAFLLCFAPSLCADITPPWSTSYDCDTDGSAGNGDTEWTAYAAPLVCDGVSKYGSEQCSTNGAYEQIVTAANNPSGGGGKGQRHWVGPANSGTNDNSGGIRLSFTSPQTKFWMRWYQRFETGFPMDTWDTLKNVWFQGDGGARNVFRPDTPLINFYIGGSSTVYTTGTNAGYGTGGMLYPTGTSDGSWHYFEVHFDIPNNTLKFWVNGIEVFNRTDISYGSTTTIPYLYLVGNIKNFSGAQCMWVDVDDIAISNTGYIGPLSASGEPVVTGLLPSVDQPSGTTGVTLQATTNVAATCKYDTTAGVAYASMAKTFSTTGGTSHSTIVTGLSDGNTYTYHVKCTDGVNPNTSDYTISFSVESAFQTIFSTGAMPLLLTQ